MKSKKHNPQYKLISIVFTDLLDHRKEYVYGETNEGDNKGLEIYFYKPDESHHYFSRRYTDTFIPRKYRETFETLKFAARAVKSGYKGELTKEQYGAFSKSKELTKAMKTNYDDQLTALLNSCLKDIYSKVKGKDEYLLFQDIESSMITNVSFLNETIEMIIDNDIDNETVYPYGFKDNGRAVSVLVINEELKRAEYELESLNIYSLAPLADLLNNND